MAGVLKFREVSFHNRRRKRHLTYRLLVIWGSRCCCPSCCGRYLGKAGAEVVTDEDEIEVGQQELKGLSHQRAGVFK